MPKPDIPLPLFSPERIAGISNLHLRIKGVVEGLIAGMHKSPFHGFSSEFLEYRPYQTGQPARSIDWRHFARSDRTVVKLFEDETNCPVRLLLDKSASMGYSSHTVSKFTYAQTLAATLAWVLVGQRDAVGLCIFDSDVRMSLALGSSSAHLKKVVSTLNMHAAGNSTHSASSIIRYAGPIKKRGLCIIFSDLLDDPEKITLALQYLRYKKQEVILVRIIDPNERTFTTHQSLRLHDVESGQEILLDGAVASEHYTTQSALHTKKIEQACRSLGITQFLVVTTDPFHQSLMNILRKRRRFW